MEVSIHVGSNHDLLITCAHTCTEGGLLTPVVIRSILTQRINLHFDMIVTGKNDKPLLTTS